MSEKEYRIKCENLFKKNTILLNQQQVDAEQIRALQKQNGELTDKVNELTDELILTNNERKDMREELKQRIRENQSLCEQIEKMKCLNEEIIRALNECLDYEWLHAHNGKAKYLYLQTVIDIVNEKFKEIKEK